MEETQRMMDRCMTSSTMKENEFSLIGKVLIVIGVIALAGAALLNVVRGDVLHPFAFSIVIFGFALFLWAKLSVIIRNRWISFGTANMSLAMANAYRLGWWLMAVGTIMTFA
jgi:hypothetical protein